MPNPAPQPASLASRNVLVLTVSDRCFAGTQVDRSGPAVAAMLAAAGANVLGVKIVPDEREKIVAALHSAIEIGTALVVTTGGTGMAERDVTPEATLAVCDRLAPGLAELIRLEGERYTPFAALSRGVCGIAGSTLIVNLPGSPAGAQSSLSTVLGLLPHALELLAGNPAHEG
jgi:molybdenum cofactor synthesis domain-containing protein